MRTTIRVGEPALGAATGRFWNSPQLVDRFPDYLFYVYCSATGALGAMEAAAAKARSLGSRDPLAALVARYLLAHLEEERDHPAWLLADLETLGFQEAEVLERTPPASVAAMIGAQYYWIEHAHPVAILGLLAVLEGLPPSAPWLESIRKRIGLPPEAFRFLAAHAEIDPHHAADLWRLLDHLPMTSSQAALVGLSALKTMAALGEIFEDLSAQRPRMDTSGR